MKTALVKDNVAFRLLFARMLELELAPELDVAFAQADSLAETHALLREEDGLDAALISVGMTDGDGLDLVRELEEDGGGRASPQARDNSLPGALRGRPGDGGGREWTSVSRRGGRPFSRPPSRLVQSRLCAQDNSRSAATLPFFLIHQSA
jgi:hypothetical protein